MKHLTRSRPGQYGTPYFYVTDANIFFLAPGTPDYLAALVGAFGTKRWHIESAQGRLITLTTTRPERRSSKDLRGAQLRKHPQTDILRMAWGSTLPLVPTKRLYIVSWEHDATQGTLLFEVDQDIRRTDCRPTRPPFKKSPHTAESALTRPAISNTPQRLRSFADLAVLRTTDSTPDIPTLTPHPENNSPAPPAPTSRDIPVTLDTVADLRDALAVLRKYKCDYGPKLQYRVKDDGTVAAAFLAEIE